jgi:amino acid transporter
VVFAAGFGTSLMLAFGSYVGFEAAALYGEEARDPRRSVPRATYIAIGSITVLYLLTSWAAISAFGTGRVQAAAASDPGGFMFAATSDQLGAVATDAMQFLVVSSLFAAFLAFHCNTARYHFALARDGLLPTSLSRTHREYGSPVVASAAQLGVVGIVTVVFGLAHKDPYLGMGASIYGLAVLAIVLLQAIAAASICGFFLRHREHETLWASLIAPALGGVGLAVGLAFMIANYATLTGSALPQLNYLPWLLPVAAIVGALIGAKSPGAVVAASASELEPS